jgi:putative ABC transport system permease protein
MESLLQDIRYALRSLRRAPAFSLAAVLTLALGIGATTAIFSVVETVALRPMPYPDADRIVYVWETRDGNRMSATAPDFADFRSGATTLSELAARTSASYTLTASGEPERLTGARITPAYFDVLGLRTVAGRTFRPEEDADNAPRVAVLGFGLWQRRFGGDTTIVGRTVVLNGIAHVVVGVLQSHVRIRDDVYTPLRLTAEERASTGAHAYVMLGRLRNGVATDAARQELVAIASRLETVRPHSNKSVTVDVVPIRQQIVGTGSNQVLMLLGAAGFVLLIACANVANLLLVRASARQREMSVRTALGASASRVVRQMLTESVLLAAIGGALGTAVAYVSLSSIVAVLPPTIPRLAEVTINGTVLWFAAAATLLVGVAFGLAPAIGASRHLAALGESGTRGTAGVQRRRMGAVLIASEVAMATVLLIGAGLMMRSLWALNGVDTGVATGNTLAARVSLPPARYAEAPRIVATYEELLRTLGTAPGTDAVAVANNLPLSGQGFTISFTVAGRAPVAPDQTPTTLHQIVSPGYFDVLGVRVLRGRGLNDTDRATSARVAVINETMARRHWPDANPIGARVTLDDGVDEPMEIVGVVSDVRQYGPARAAVSELYAPIAQAPPIVWRWVSGTMSVLVRGRGSAAELGAQVNRAVWSIDRDLAVFGVTTLDDVLGNSTAPSRLLMYLLAAFAGLAVLLAAVGIYGVIAFTVAQRTRELGIRVALGATASTVRGLVVRHGMVVTATGIGIGMAASFLLTRSLAASLFGVGPTDALTLVSVALLLSAVAAAACVIPARRAARVDPMVALRND